MILLLLLWPLSGLMVRFIEIDGKMSYFITQMDSNQIGSAIYQIYKGIQFNSIASLLPRDIIYDGCPPMPSRLRRFFGWYGDHPRVYMGASALLHTVVIVATMGILRDNLITYKWNWIYGVGLATVIARSLFDGSSCGRNCLSTADSILMLTRSFLEAKAGSSKAYVWVAMILFSVAVIVFFCEVLVIVREHGPGQRLIRNYPPSIPYLLNEDLGHHHPPIFQLPHLVTLHLPHHLILPTQIPMHTLQDNMLPVIGHLQSRSSATEWLRSTARGDPVLDVEEGCYSSLSFLRFLRLLSLWLIIIV